MCSSSLFARVFFLLFWPSLSLGAYNISATGGGIIPSGQTLTLSATIGSDFDRCYWYFPSNPEDKCIFGDGKLIRCSNDELKARVNYTGTDASVCQITLSGFKKEDEGNYECSIDGQSPKGSIGVSLATKIQKIELRVGNESEGYLEAGKNGPIFCLLHGGKPVGESNISVSSGVNITSDETSIIKDSKGEESSSHQIMIQADVNDHGAIINCTGSQFDQSDEKKKLFEDVSAPSTSLVVVFPPQSLEPLVFTGKIDEELRVMIPVHSNPSPDTFKWVSHRKGNGSETTTTELKNGNKVKIPKICSHVAENKKNCSLIFTKLSKEDVNGVSYELLIENKFGQAKLAFSLRTPNSTTVSPTSTTTSLPSNTTVVPGNSTSAPSNTTSAPSTTTPAPGGGGMSSYVIPLVIFIVIIVVLIGGMIAYKRYSAKRQTAPMTMQ